MRSWTTYLGGLCSFLLSVAVLVSGCKGPNELTAQAKEQIDDGANRIVLVRDDPGAAIEPGSAAFDLYNDALSHYADNGFLIDASDDDELIFSTEPKQVEPNIALRFDGHVQAADGGGSRLVVTVEYAPDDLSPQDEWDVAAWTSGNAKLAFGEAFVVTQGLPHSDIGTATE